MVDNPGFFSTSNNTSSSSSENTELDYLKKEVGQRFPFYDVKMGPGTIAFFCRIDETTLEEKFNDLRGVLAQKNYIPLLKDEHGEHVLYVLKKPQRKERSCWVNIGLFVAVFITTALTGSILYQNYFDLWSLPNWLDVLKPENLGYGILLFALPLLAILAIHEMGHYYISKKHHIATSLPYFIPIPPILPSFNIGTFGALISSGDPMPNKKALFDVGIAGPIAGFIVALPVTIIGIMTSEIVAVSEITQGETVLGTSVLFFMLSKLLITVPEGYVLNLSLTAFAGWVGLLITSINLLPAGQLDGGHIFRAVLGEHQKYAGWIAVFIMIFTGWWFFALIIVFMMGMRHPPPLNDATAIDHKRKLLFLAAVAMLVLCYIPYPIYAV